ncbi:MAG: tRNA pseudouridine(55) synthase TruB [Planctomycetales bacterium]|nr:tRNA pseudouridine(55) synthase TruB [Planctomycetales bacterium]
MFGLLNVNKPSGITSRDAVNQIQRLIRPHKVGHAGTLDPLASGVLVIGVGGATRLISYVHQLPKSYLATFVLGQSSVTDDIEGEVTRLADAPVPSRIEVDRILPEFIGTISQVPPAYSAVKVNGNRAYALARKGHDVTLTARDVEIFDLQVVRYEYPAMELLIHCGSGTYVRAIGRDLAQRLGTVAVMSCLCRTSVGPFALDSAVELSQLRELGVAKYLRPAVDAVPHLPRVSLSAEQVATVSMGKFVELSAGGDHREMAATDERTQLVAILTCRAPGTWGASKCFTSYLPTFPG